MKCLRCNDTGLVGLRTRDLRYHAPGPVPEDARGVVEAECGQCPPIPSCYACDETEGLRRFTADGGPAEYTCAECWRQTDTGPAFDDLPLLEDKE